MAQRVRTPHRGSHPSSVTQLPILTALHARFPTLFLCIIHQESGNVNNFFEFSEGFRNPLIFPRMFLWIMMKKTLKMIEKPLLFVRYCFIISLNHKGGVSFG